VKEYETLTREKVDVVPFGCGMPETHLMQDWSDRMLDLILNGPTINGIKKDEVRAMLRETYTALKQYEKIGPMASPFINDPTAGGIGFCGLLAVAFIVLKLTGVINWSWLWVLAPIWIPTAISLAIIVIVLVAILVRELTKGGRP